GRPVPTPGRVQRARLRSSSSCDPTPATAGSQISQGVRRRRKTNRRGGDQMRVRRVYIKKAGGEIASEACYTAWRGVSHLGYPLDFFEWDDLVGKCLRLNRNTLVIGGTVAPHMALRQIGVDVPLPLNLPQPLLSFAGRKVWETTLGAIRKEADAGQVAPVF